MRVTRIILADLPAGLILAVREAVRGQPDLVVVADCPREVDLLLGASQADVAVVAVNAVGSGLGTVERVLDAGPDLAVLAVDWDQRQAWLCRRDTTRTRLPKASMQDLADTLRGAIDSHVVFIRTPP